MRKVNKVIIHCSATRPEWMADAPLEDKIDEIRRWHLGNGWSDIGYHWLIDRDGTTLPGRPESLTGAHTRGQNTGSIGVCLLGGHGSAASDSFRDNFTEEQESALKELLQDLQWRYGLLSIHGHNEFAAKACPGFQVDEWLEGLK